MGDATDPQGLLGEVRDLDYQVGNQQYDLNQATLANDAAAVAKARQSIDALTKQRAEKAAAYRKLSGFDAPPPPVHITIGPWIADFMNHTQAQGWIRYVGWTLHDFSSTNSSGGFDPTTGLFTNRPPGNLFLDGVNLMPGLAANPPEPDIPHTVSPAGPPSPVDHPPETPTSNATDQGPSEFLDPEGRTARLANILKMVHREPVTGMPGMHVNAEDPSYDAADVWDTLDHTDKILAAFKQAVESGEVGKDIGESLDQLISPDGLLALAAFMLAMAGMQALGPLAWVADATGLLVIYLALGEALIDICNICLNDVSNAKNKWHFDQAVHKLAAAIASIGTVWITTFVFMLLGFFGKKAVGAIRGEEPGPATTSEPTKPDLGKGGTWDALAKDEPTGAVKSPEPPKAPDAPPADPPGDLGKWDKQTRWWDDDEPAMDQHGKSIEESGEVEPTRNMSELDDFYDPAKQEISARTAVDTWRNAVQGAKGSLPPTPELGEVTFDQYMKAISEARDGVDLMGEDYWSFGDGESRAFLEDNMNNPISKDTWMKDATAKSDAEPPVSGATLRGPDGNPVGTVRPAPLPTSQTPTVGAPVPVRGPEFGAPGAPLSTVRSFLRNIPMPVKVGVGAAAVVVLVGGVKIATDSNGTKSSAQVHVEGTTIDSGGVPSTLSPGAAPGTGTQVPVGPNRGTGAGGAGGSVGTTPSGGGGTAPGTVAPSGGTVAPAGGTTPSNSSPGGGTATQPTPPPTSPPTSPPTTQASHAGSKRQTTKLDPCPTPVFNKATYTFDFNIPDGANNPSYAFLVPNTSTPFSRPLCPGAQEQVAVNIIKPDPGHPGKEDYRITVNETDQGETGNETPTVEIVVAWT